MTGTIHTDRGRWEALVMHIRDMGGAVTAFSGGVDSSLLVAAAQEALGDRALAVTARSPSYPDHERDRAVEVARIVGIRHRFVESTELDDPSYRANPPDRCYYCKQDLFGALRRVADEEGLPHVLDGTNADDAGDYRPGRRAARELGVCSPMAELGMGKAEIRRLSRARDLPTWDLPAFACLASRVPYGEEISPERLARIGAAEDGVRALGFPGVRVRDHGGLARVEVAPDELDRAAGPGVRTAIVRACRDAGYTWVCLDLEGYRTGSMNAALDLTR